MKRLADTSTNGCRFVIYQDPDGYCCVRILIRRLLGVRRDKTRLVDLQPDQALALLRWLEQTRTIIEQLPSQVGGR